MVLVCMGLEVLYINIHSIVNALRKYATAVDETHRECQASNFCMNIVLFNPDPSYNPIDIPIVHNTRVCNYLQFFSKHLWPSRPPE
jgi:hypothetical protein